MNPQQICKKCHFEKMGLAQGNAQTEEEGSDTIFFLIKEKLSTYLKTDASQMHVLS